MGKATQDLRNEHGAILHVFTILDRMLISTDRKVEDDLRFGNELIEFLQVFADKCHHGKEEGMLFPAMEKNGVPVEGGPIGVMLQEHVQGRQLIAAMKNALQSNNLSGFKSTAAEYQQLLRNHIAKENNVLFAMADRVLNDEQQDNLFEKFEEHEETVIGHGVHEELHARIERWDKEFK